MLFFQAKISYSSNFTIIFSPPHHAPQTQRKFYIYRNYITRKNQTIEKQKTKNTPTQVKKISQNTLLRASKRHPETIPKESRRKNEADIYEL
jgi:hypothetical protein